jgi:hypothetical protein
MKRRKRAVLVRGRSRAGSWKRLDFMEKTDKMSLPEHRKLYEILARRLKWLERSIRATQTEIGKDTQQMAKEVELLEFINRPLETLPPAERKAVILACAKILRENHDPLAKDAEEAAEWRNDKA